jgi:hypothetical protein
VDKSLKVPATLQADGADVIIGEGFWTLGPFTLTFGSVDAALEFNQRLMMVIRDHKAKRDVDPFPVTYDERPSV